MKLNSGQQPNQMKQHQERLTALLMRKLVEENTITLNAINLATESAFSLCSYRNFSNRGNLPLMIDYLDESFDQFTSKDIVTIVHSVDSSSSVISSSKHFDHIFNSLIHDTSNPESAMRFIIRIIQDYDGDLPKGKTWNQLIQESKKDPELFDIPPVILFNTVDVEKRDREGLEYFGLSDFRLNLANMGKLSHESKAQDDDFLYDDLTEDDF